MGGNRARRAAAMLVVLGMLLTGLPAAAQPSVAPFCDPEDGGNAGGAADFAFVIDTSGSMRSNDSQRIRVTASQNFCLLYTSPSPRDLSTSRMPSSA